MTPPPPPGPEAEARESIDVQLAAAGWIVQDREQINLSAGRGVAIREFKLAAGYGYADYLLYVDERALGAFEAKKAGDPLTGIERQVTKYSAASRPRSQLLRRDKVSLDIFWLRDESLEDSANLPEPQVLAEEIAEDLRASLEQMEEILGDLRARARSSPT